ncbi:extracellular scp domain-containing protein [Podospora appendiculata]|uniref:Extracellular scp domain-containing protein n=1 Tax=Podospora appendiculata TaxID=314037 RepID=A0AAE1CG22_9PEZI|nr:extracellular scp domain-containing protein [Podospora appendiculata]
MRLPSRCNRLLLAVVLLSAVVESAPAYPAVIAAVAATSVRSPQPVPISQSPQFVSDADFTAAILNSTNHFRHQHNASAVTYNATLDQFATAYLDANRDCTFAHSGGPYGENIALGCSDVQGCVDAWGNERAKYDFDHPDFVEDTGHFTQLVWRNTTAVGCGRKLCGEKGWFLVCEYFPRGNVLGAFGDAVGRQVDGFMSAGSESVLRPSMMWLVLWLAVALVLFW